MASLRAEQLCGMNFHYFRYPLARFLDDAVALGLSRVELWGAAPHFYVEDEPLRRAREIRAALTDRGLALTCFTPEQCIYPINIAAREEALRSRSIGYFLQCLTLCIELGAPALLVTPGWGYVGESREEAWRRSADALGLLARHAERLGIDLLLEPLTPTESNIINSAQHLRAMMDELASPRVKAILDTVAMEVMGETFDDYFRLFPRELAHVHLIDGERDGSHLAWGDGSFSLEAYLAALARHGYGGALSFEFTSPRYWLDPLPPLRDSCAAAKSLMGQS